MCKDSNLSASLPTLVIMFLKIYSLQPSECDMVFLCDLDLHFPNEAEQLFMCFFSQ